MRKKRNTQTHTAGKTKTNRHTQQRKKTKHTQQRKNKHSRKKQTQQKKKEQNTHSREKKNRTNHGFNALSSNTRKKGNPKPPSLVKTRFTWEPQTFTEQFDSLAGLTNQHLA